MWAPVLFILGGYLLGAFPLLYLLGRLRGFELRGEDMHLSLWRKVGYAEGTVGIIWDIGKGIPLPLIALWWLDFGVTVAALSGLAVLVGQMWSVFLRFEGEKGNSTGLGVAGALVLKALAISLIPIATGALIRFFSSLRKRELAPSQRLKFAGQSDVVPLGMLFGYAILPIFAWVWYPQELVLTWACLAMLVLIVIKRLTEGLREDLKLAGSNKRSILLYRLLYDRSQR